MSCARSRPPSTSPQPSRHPTSARLVCLHVVSLLVACGGANGNVTVGGGPGVAGLSPPERYGQAIRTAALAHVESRAGLEQLAAEHLRAASRGGGEPIWVVEQAEAQERARLYAEARETALRASLRDLNPTERLRAESVISRVTPQIPAGLVRVAILVQPDGARVELSRADRQRKRAAERLLIGSGHAWLAPGTWAIETSAKGYNSELRTLQVGAEDNLLAIGLTPEDQAPAIVNAPPPADGGEVPVAQEVAAPPPALPLAVVAPPVAVPPPAALPPAVPLPAAAPTVATAAPALPTVAVSPPPPAPAAPAEPSKPGAVPKTAEAPKPAEPPKAPPAKPAPAVQAGQLAVQAEHLTKPAPPAKAPEVPQPVEAAKPSEPAKPSESAKPSEPALAVAAGAQPDTGSSWLHTVGPIAVAGLGVLAIGAGGWFGYQAVADASSANGLNPKTKTYDSDIDNLAASANSHAALSTALFIGGGVLVAAGSAWWLFAPQAASATGHRSMALSAGPLPAHVQRRAAAPTVAVSPSSVALTWSF